MNNSNIEIIINEGGGFVLLISHSLANRIDAFLIENSGIPRDILIEHAAIAVTKSCISYLDKQKSQGFICTANIFAGKGMNGLDAFACARNLHASGYKVALWEVFPASDQPTEPNKPQLQPSSKNEISSEKTPWQISSCKNFGMNIKPAIDYVPEKNGLIVDGIFGTAFSLEREFPPVLQAVFRKINEGHKTGSHVIAIDLPSGVETDTGDASPYTIMADETITFISPKIGIISYPGRKYAGEIHVDLIGIPLPLIEKIMEEVNFKSNTNSIKNHMENSTPFMFDRSMASLFIPKRPKDGHKGTFGRVGIVGGSKGMAGSICLSAMAAMRCGVGLAYMRVPKGIESDCMAVVPEALISTDYKPALDGTDAVLIGPGLDNSKQSTKKIWNAVSTNPHLVLDAGALNIIAKNMDIFTEHLKKRSDKKLPLLILTPHPGEFKRLAPDLALCNRIEATRIAAKRFGVIIVMKGAGTVIADPDGNTCINSTGNSAMAKGGSGDVLAGMLTAFLAQGKDPFMVSAFAVYFHGLCGDLAAQENGEFAAIPSDFIKKIPEAFNVIGNEGEHHECKKVY